MTGTTTVLDSVLAVFTKIGDWISTSVNSLTPMFYNDGALTFMGTMCVAGLGFSVIFLLIGLIQKFLRFGAQF